jgi:hypothetical protein
VTTSTSAPSTAAELAVVGILAFPIAVAIALLRPGKTPFRLQHSRPMSLSFDDVAAQAGNEPPAA